jgi:Ala-tRNA(Pro) deacylase
MSIPQRIRDFLDSHGVAYEQLSHPQSFTGQDTAHTLHISGKKCVKTIVLDGDGKFVMAVIPAATRINLQDLQEAMEAKHLEMLPESELVKLLPDCERGAIPPLGPLYGMDVWVDRAISSSEQIVFCAGTHEDSVRMTYSDFAKLTRPRNGRFIQIRAAA